MRCFRCERCSGKIRRQAVRISVEPDRCATAGFYKDPANESWLTAPEQADVQYVVLDLDTLKQRDLV